MEKKLKVAFMGLKPPLGEQPDLSIIGFGTTAIGIRTFNMRVEMALDVIRNTPQGLLADHTFPGLPPPQKECEVMMGGRLFPSFTRAEISKVIKNVDLLIISGGMELNYTRAFLMWISPETISDKCTVVLRMPFTKEEKNIIAYDNASQILREMKMDSLGSRNTKAKKSSKSPHNPIFVIGLEEYGGCDPEISIPLLQSHLLQEDIIEQLVQPVKETKSFGKSLFSKITSWMV